MDGIILINKKKGVTSRDVVNIISQKLNIKKVGHTGTLDPLATGVLVICIGKATKIVELMTNEDKEYIAEVTLGIKTDTLDITGNVIEEEICFKTKEEIIEALNIMKGEYEQEVPIYSAVKIKGKKLYEYAKNKEKVELPKRLVNIKEINLIGDIKYVDSKVIFSFKCKVSKGTYIRSLIDDIAKKLNTIGVMSNLTRIKQGNFSLDDCITIDEFVEGKYKLKRIKEVLPYPQITVDDNLKKAIKNGKVIKNFYNHKEILFIDSNGLELALYHEYKKDKNYLKPWKVFI